MQWEDQQQQIMPDTPLSPTSTITTLDMWWDNETTTTAILDAPANNDGRLQNNHAPTINQQQDDMQAARQSAHDVEHYLRALRQEAESQTAPTTSRRARFREWVETRSNVDPLTAQVIGSSEETSPLPAHGPAPSTQLKPPPTPTSIDQQAAPMDVTTTPGNRTIVHTSPTVVLEQLYTCLQTGLITVSQGIDDRIYLIVQDWTKQEWDKESLRVPRPPNFLQRYGLMSYDPLN
jgi:hypothetical protein